MHIIKIQYINIFVTIWQILLSNITDSNYYLIESLLIYSKYIIDYIVIYIPYRIYTMDIIDYIVKYTL